MSGFENDVVVGKNLNFDNAGARPHLGVIDAAGKIPIGTGDTAPTPEILGGSLTSPLGTLQIGYSSPNITLDLVGGSVAVDSVALDTGISPINPNASGLLTLTAGVVAAGTNPLRTDGTGASTAKIEAQFCQAIAATDATKVGLSTFDSSQFTVDASGFVSTSATAVANTITGTTGGALPPTAHNWNIVGGTLSAGLNPTTTSGSGSTLTVSSINCSRWIVDGTAGRGTHTTIQGAIDAASSGDIIFVRPGTYSETLTLKGGVAIVGFQPPHYQAPQITIIGTCTLSTAGTASFENIGFLNNLGGAAGLVVSGTLGSKIYVVNCTIQCAGGPFASLTATNSASEIMFRSCYIDVAVNTGSYFSLTGTGTIGYRDCTLKNATASTHANLASAGQLNLDNCGFLLPITTSGTNSSSIIYCTCDLGSSNTTNLTIGGSGTNEIRYSRFSSGTASAVSIGSSAKMSFCSVDSTNANAVTGAGTLYNGGIVFSNTSHTINTTTQTALDIDVGAISFDGGTNLLANYATSTWTPGVAFGGAATGVTYTTQTGYYTRIGNIVFISAYILLSSKGSSVGNMTITGLPIAAAASPLVSMAISETAIITLTATYTNMNVRPVGGGTTMNVSASSNSAGGGTINVTDAMLANTSKLVFSGCYFV